LAEAIATANFQDKNREQMRRAVFQFQVEVTQHFATVQFIKKPGMIAAGFFAL